jgi:hypothetical protein
VNKVLHVGVILLFLMGCRLGRYRIKNQTVATTRSNLFSLRWFYNRFTEVYNEEPAEDDKPGEVEECSPVSGELK